MSALLCSAGREVVLLLLHIQRYAADDDKRNLLLVNEIIPLLRANFTAIDCLHSRISAISTAQQLLVRDKRR